MIALRAVCLAVAVTAVLAFLLGAWATGQDQNTRLVQLEQEAEYRDDAIGDLFAEIDLMRKENR